MRDLRIRNSVRSTPVPFGSRAYVFINLLDNVVKVIIAPDREHAVRRFNEFRLDQGIDIKGWMSLPLDDDFEVICPGDVLPRR